MNKDTINDLFTTEYLPNAKDKYIELKTQLATTLTDFACEIFKDFMILPRDIFSKEIDDDNVYNEILKGYEQAVKLQNKNLETVLNDDIFELTDRLIKVVTIVQFIEKNIKEDSKCNCEAQCEDCKCKGE